MLYRALWRCWAYSSTNLRILVTLRRVTRIRDLDTVYRYSGYIATPRKDQRHLLQWAMGGTPSMDRTCPVRRASAGSDCMEFPLGLVWITFGVLISVDGRVSRYLPWCAVLGRAGQHHIRFRKDLGKSGPVRAWHPAPGSLQ
ncbi:hypothetical protein [Pseudomonas phage PIP]|nr:hypothetical protein [Pseudomonas phage PIP]